MRETKVTGVTPGGFEFTTDVRAISDMEFLEDLANVDKNPLVLPRLCERMLGNAGKKALYDFCRDEDGYVTAEAIEPVFTDILKILSEKSKEVKNS